MPIFEILGKKWTIEILRFLSDSMKGFSEIEGLVKNPRTTSKRLKDLENFKIVKREVQQDKQRTVQYSLTKLGQEVVEKISEIEKLFN